MPCFAVQWYTDYANRRLAFLKSVEHCANSTHNEGK